MKAFFADEQRLHYPRSFLAAGVPKDNPEVPERVERLLAGAKTAGCEITRPASCGVGPIASVHTPEYVEFLQGIHARWRLLEGASEEVIPNIHPFARGGSYPTSPAGQAGYHMADTSCPISVNTWESACWSAWTAVAAVEDVENGAACAYALCRPPGHHAFADAAGGFCFFNNAAGRCHVIDLRTR